MLAHRVLQSPLGTLRVTADEAGVCSIHWLVPADAALADAPELGERADLCADPQEADLAADPCEATAGGRAAAHWVNEAAAQLAAYFRGERATFTVPLSMRGGTAFQKAVWNALLQIPYGETRSYRDIAAAIGNPKAVRAVGQANRANPVPILVPCHRVIGQSGALVGYAGSQVHLKASLLALEQSRQALDLDQPAQH
ncbi:methylated-DNA--[protein]-cysteine S-methyltransferase [Alicyclobacillus cycloheptanicus]|uniref:methylated-DNA--[protein]-cysteine S-methyltransferase n=1 Tax=Alicyclobacillus cycloheptanicus TaxID=1457 RepID=UPI002378170B|nr:methylated-DNA--[protein]-cysteine S-methyltransferase [Alicyclobacillus cycloheptanicus]